MSHSAQQTVYNTLSVYLTRTADKAQRKLDRPLREKIKDALIRISSNPENVGEKLTSPLTGIYSHHIKYKGREFRIAYLINPHSESIVILLIGAHENFYRRLKSVMDAMR